jgi:hypothetical protein
MMANVSGNEDGGSEQWWHKVNLDTRFECKCNALNPLVVLCMIWFDFKNVVWQKWMVFWKGIEQNTPKNLFKIRLIEVQRSGMSTCFIFNNLHH